MDRRQILGVFGPFDLRYRLPEHAAEPIVGDATGLVPLPRELRARGQPEEALGAQQLATEPVTVEQLVEFLGMERHARMVGEARDAVLLGLRHVLAAHLLQPARCLLCTIETEATGIQHLGKRHGALRHGQNLGLRVERAQHGRQLIQLGCLDHVRLADQQHIAELDLVNQQVGDIALIVLAEAFPGVGQ